MAETPLDRAHREMLKTPENDAVRLRFYCCLADSQLFVLLAEEPVDDTVIPELFPIDGARYAAAFDTEERLTDFSECTVPYAALPGRALAGLLADQGLGLALNPDVAPSAILLPPEAVTWLAGAISSSPAEEASRIKEVAPPDGLPEGLLTVLEAKLSAAVGLAASAHLAAATYEDGRRGHLLAFLGAETWAQSSLAQAAGEAVIFSGIEASELDVTFVGKGDLLVERLARVGLRIDLPVPEVEPGTRAPGTDPARPPRLR